MEPNVQRLNHAMNTLKKFSVIRIPVFQEFTNASGIIIHVEITIVQKPIQLLIPMNNVLLGSQNVLNQPAKVVPQP